MNNLKNFNMTQEEKDLLIKDLSARLSYEVIVRCYFVDGGGEEVLDTDDIADLLYNDEDSEFPMYKPYFRLLSNMTEEEAEEYNDLVNKLSEYDCQPELSASKMVDWLNAHYFDYHGLIEKGLALEAPGGMYE